MARPVLAAALPLLAKLRRPQLLLEDRRLQVVFKAESQGSCGEGGLSDGLRKFGSTWLPLTCFLIGIVLVCLDEIDETDEIDEIDGIDEIDEIDERYESVNQ